MTATMLLQLPEDILTNIFKHLRFQDIYSLMLTCKTVCNLIINDNVLWRSKAQSIHYSYEGPTRLILQTRRNNGPSRQHWYNNCRASYNWCKGYFKNKVILQHRTNYMPWLRLFHSEVLLVSVGPRLHCYALQGVPNCNKLLWKIEVPHVVRNDIRTHDITRFILNDDLLVCGNRDGSTAVYKVDHIRARPRLIQQIRDCHREGLVEVTAVELGRRTCGHYVVTASNDNSNIQFWHQDTDEERRNDYQNNYKSYKDIALDEDIGVRCLALNETADKLAVGPNGNNRPLLLDTTTGQLLITNYDTKNRKQTIRDIQWHNEHSVIYVTHSGHLQLLDVRNNAVVYTAVDPFQSTLYCVQTDGRRACVAGSSEYARCVLYDLCSPRHVQMYFTQKRSSPVYSLDFDASTLVAAADRGLGACNFDILPSTTFTRDYSDIFQSL